MNADFYAARERTVTPRQIIEASKAEDRAIRVSLRRVGAYVSLSVALPPAWMIDAARSEGAQ